MSRNRVRPVVVEELEGAVLARPCVSRLRLRHVWGVVHARLRLRGVHYVEINNPEYTDDGAVYTCDFIIVLPPVAKIGNL